MVSLTFTSWNQLVGWLRQIGELRRVALIAGLAIYLASRPWKTRSIRMAWRS